MELSSGISSHAFWRLMLFIFHTAERFDDIVIMISVKSVLSVSSKSGFILQSHWTLKAHASDHHRSPWRVSGGLSCVRWSKCLRLLRWILDFCSEYSGGLFWFALGWSSDMDWICDHRSPFQQGPSNHWKYGEGAETWMETWINMNRNNLTHKQSASVSVEPLNDNTTWQRKLIWSCMLCNCKNTFIYSLFSHLQLFWH